MIEYLICLIITLILSLWLTFRKKIGLKQEYVSIFISWSVFSIIFSNHLNIFSPNTAILTSISIVSLSFFSLIYILIDSSISSAIVFLGVFIYIIGMISAVLSQYVKYTHPEHFSLFFSIALLVIALFVILLDRKYINPKTKLYSTTWIYSLLIGCVLLIYHEHLEITYLINLLLFFLLIENPTFYFDKLIGCYNTSSLQLWLDRVFKCKKNNYFVISICVPEDSEGIKIWTIVSLIKAALSHKDCKVFRSLNSNILIFTKKKDKEITHDIKDLLDKRNIDGYQIVLLDNLLLCKSKDAFFKILRQQLYKNNKQKITNISGEEIIKVFEEKDIEDSIKLAILEDRIEIFIQPIYSVRDNCFLSGEVLARIRNKDNTFMPPSIFIPIAEKTGLIKDIDECVFRKTCFLLSKLPKAYNIKYLEVNLSVLQGENTHLAESYKRIMENYNVPADCINLEITETATLEQKERLLLNMESLINYGVNFALDDFGSGKSNIDYFISMPVSMVKIDYNMTQAYFREDKAKHAVNAIIKMANEMGVKVVFEGVENKDQLKAVKSLPIDFIQGYCFSKPLPIDEYMEFCKENCEKVAL